MLVAMAYHITGNMIHELVGVFLFGLFMVHNILNGGIKRFLGESTRYNKFLA
jgi:hypothetical protein